MSESIGSIADQAAPGDSGAETVLPKLCEALTAGRVTARYAAEQAGSRLLADATTAEGCEQLAAMLTTDNVGDTGLNQLVLAHLTLCFAGGLAERRCAGEGLLLYDAAASFFERRAEWRSLAGCYLSKAKGLVLSDRWSEVIAACNTAEPYFRKHGSEPDLYECLFPRAYALYAINRFDAAIRDYDELVKIAESLERWEDLADCLSQRADTSRVMGKHTEAVEDWTASESLYRRHEQELKRAYCLRYRAVSQNALHEYEEALADIVTARALYKQHGLKVDEAECQSTQSEILQNVHRYDEALKECDEAKHVFEERGSDVDVAKCCMNRGRILYDLGRYDEAVTELDAAERVFKQEMEKTNLQFVDRCHVLWAVCLVDRAPVMVKLGRYADAVTDCDAARRIFEQEGRTLQVAACDHNRGLALCEGGMYEMAVRSFNMAEPVLHERGRKAQLQADRSVALIAVGRYREAVADCDAAAPVLASLGRTMQLALCRMNRALARQNLRENEAALADYGRVDTKSLPEESLIRFHGNLGMLLWEMRQRQEATDHLARSRRALRAALRVGRIDELSLEFVSRQQYYVHVGVRCALENGADRTAFEALQDGKAGLFDELRQRLAANAERESEAIHQNRGRLISWLRQGRPHGNETHDVVKEYFRTWRLSSRSLAARATDLPEKSSADPVEAIRRVLPDGWAVLDFWQGGEEEIYVFFVSQEEFHARPLKVPFKDARLRKDLDQLRQDILDLGMVSPFVRTWEPALTSLGLYLFEPLRTLLEPLRGFYLVPHGELHSYPLHACRWNDNGRSVALCDRFEVAYLPSASLLPQLLPVRPIMSALSLANPERCTDATLPFSEWEATQLSARLPLTRLRQAIGPKEATFAATGGWDDVDLVHFTCHGVGDESFAPLSHLRLADDLLLAHDVMYRRDPLRAGALVVLNGCQTGVRDSRAIDEGLGLMTAFLLRGASCIATIIFPHPATIVFPQ